VLVTHRGLRYIHRLAGEKEKAYCRAQITGRSTDSRPSRSLD